MSRQGRMSLRPKSTNDIINLLKSDLAYDPVLTTATLSKQFLKDLNIGQGGNHRIGGELALLAFAKKLKAKFAWIFRIR